ncbi:MAG: hypothetical protein H7A25_22155 [Leptospiraceae bacterium]|nr:hypothetical protein [Leptospiraceae bacterium]MCP5502618.1 hypothetical protein [Leptospiraceae bacterium]
MLASSLVSTPDIFSGGKFLGFTASDLNPLQIEDYQCPRGTKVSLYQDKILSSTKVTGRNGTIKELAGFDDWHITIEFLFIPFFTSIPSISFDSGIQLNSLDKFTTDELKDILAIWKSNWKKKPSLKVNNQLFSELGIENIVLTKFELPTRDRDHELPVRLEALSDSIIDLGEPD